MDTRDETDAQFAHMSDEELRAASSDPSVPARLLPALKAELRSRRASPSMDHQPWQHTPPVVHFPPTMQVVVTDVHMSFGSMIVFMVKWAFASIPAFIIIIGVYLAVILGVNALGARLGG